MAARRDRCFTLADVLEQQAEQAESSQGGLARDLTMYTMARLGMLAVTIAILILCGVPLLVAAIVSIVVVMPLSMLVFADLRRRVATGMAERAEVRRQRRSELKAQLRGDE